MSQNLTVSERVGQLQVQRGPTVQRDGSVGGGGLVQLLEKKEKDTVGDVEDVELDLK